MQLALVLPEKKPWGGPRKGAGRKGSGQVSHARRAHEKDHPVLVTMKVLADVPSLRGFRLAQPIGRFFRSLVGRRGDFRVVEFCIQSNHLHLLVEADSALALSRGMQGLASSLARRINARLRRGGQLWRDRYHSKELTNPTMTRNALRYLLQNRAHHGGEAGIDRWSSAPWFGGFTDAVPAASGSPVAPAQTWLLRTGWHFRGGGKLSVHERPA
jgi:REP element-mobilizing transposase RayT